MFTLPKEFLDFAETNVFAKALIEWAVSILSVEEFKGRLTKQQRQERFFEIHLESLLIDSKKIIKNLNDFLGLQDSDNMHELAERLLNREQTFSVRVDSLIDNSGNDVGITEEDLLALAGHDLRSLIYKHSYKIRTI